MECNKSSWHCLNFNGPKKRLFHKQFSGSQLSKSQRPSNIFTHKPTKKMERNEKNTTQHPQVPPPKKKHLDFLCCTFFIPFQTLKVTEVGPFKVIMLGQLSQELPCCLELYRIGLPTLLDIGKAERLKKKKSNVTFQLRNLSFNVLNLYVMKMVHS